VLHLACRPPRAGLSPCASLYLPSSGDRCREDLLDRLQTPGGQVSPGGADHESVSPIAQLAVIGATTKKPMTAPYVAPVRAASRPRRSRTSRDLSLRLCDTASPALPSYDTACPVSLRHRLRSRVTTPPALQQYGATRDASRLDFSRLRLPRLAVLATHHEQAGRRHSPREEHLLTKSSDRSRCLITGDCRACRGRRDRPSTSLDEAGVGHGVGAASVRHDQGILHSMRARFHVKRGPGGRWVYWWSRTAFSARAA